MYECLPACMYVYYVCGGYPSGPEQGIGFLETSFVNFCQCWESNPFPLQEQQVFLTADLYIPLLLKFQMPTEVENSKNDFHGSLSYCHLYYFEANSSDFFFNLGLISWTALSWS